MAESNLNRGLGNMGFFDTQGGEVLQGIGGITGDAIQGFGRFAQGLLNTPSYVADQFTSPSDQFIAEQERLRDNISGVTGGNFGEEKPSMGNIRPEEIQSQIDILNKAPGDDPLTVDQINELYRKDAKGGKFKPFPTDQARQVKDQNLANKFGSGAADTATAQNLAVEFKKEKAKEQIKADANREASLDMPNMSDDPTEQLFAQAMTDYISKAREGAEGQLPEVGDIEAYKKKFAEATGVDISGKPDTSQALMAMGLSMMQNRAGKGFDVGKIFNAVGEAGEKALPLLSKAKTEARNNVIAAGKYALQTEATDEKTRKAAEKELMNRGQYWIYKKGGEEGEFLRDKNGIMPFDEGSFKYLNKSEMNNLINDPEFNKQFSFIDGSRRFEILKARAEAEGIDYGDQWNKELKQVSLIGGKSDDLPPALQVAGYAESSNYKGKSTTKYKLQEDKKGVVSRFVDFQNEVNKNADGLENLIENLQEGISIPAQLVDKVKQLGISFGIDVDTSSTYKAKKALKNIAIDEVLRILKESGRTISEGERERVEQRVGQVRLNLEGSDLNAVLGQVEYVYDMVVTGAQKDLDTAISSFENNFGETISNKSTSGPKDQAEVDEFNKMYGTEFTMETFPKD